MERFIIAIDGPSGSGKSTVARSVAERTGCRYLDTGAMYRSLTLIALREGLDPESGAKLAERLRDLVIEFVPGGIRLDGEDVSVAIRTGEVTRLVARIAAHPAIRAEMVTKQRAAWPGQNMVVEGRDIGTVVFPDACLKVFLTASPDERAVRRAKETGRRVEEIRREQSDRDALDRGREHSPLVEAEDAVRIDTTGLTIEEVVERVTALVESAAP